VTTRDRAPVFVVGTARSGTSLLYHMLLSSGTFPLYRAEPLVFEVLVPRFGNLRQAASRRKLLRCWLRSKPFRRSGLEARIVEEKVMGLARNGGEFLNIIMEEMALAGGFSRWAVWGPDNLLQMPLIKRQIPNALFIHVIRDGRDVACSLDRMGFVRPFPWNSQDRLLPSALHWRWKTAKGRRYGKDLGEDYLEVRFEDLTERPKLTLARISAFLSQELDEERIRRAAIGTLRTPNTSFQEELRSGTFSPVGRSARLISQPRLAQLEKAIGALLAELGYPLCYYSTPTTIRLGLMCTLYFHCCDMKEWLKANTRLGRFVNMSGLYLDKEDDPVEVAEHLEGIDARASIPEGLKIGGSVATT
jgi:hypothetical protein